MRFVCITSGKGGVGKTNFTVNLALALKALGLRVAIFDADLGTGNINILLNIRPQYDISAVLGGQKKLKEVITTYNGILIIPGSHGLAEMANLETKKLERLATALKSMERRTDFMLIDTSSGISSDVLSFSMSSKETIFVVTPEPTSVTDAYALMKLMVQSEYQGRMFVVVNWARSRAEAHQVFNTLDHLVYGQLNSNISLLGYILFEPGFRKAVVNKKPLLEYLPDCQASEQFNKLARHFATWSPGKQMPAPDFVSSLGQGMQRFGEILDTDEGQGPKPPNTPEEAVSLALATYETLRKSLTNGSGAPNVRLRKVLDNIMLGSMTRSINELTEISGALSDMHQEHQRLKTRYGALREKHEEALATIQKLKRGYVRLKKQLAVG